jgi:hypothetical protein
MRYASYLIAATVISSAPSAAQASARICGDALHMATGKELRSVLKVSRLQASRLQAIRHEMSSYRRWLQRELDHVTRELNRKREKPLPARYAQRLRQHQASLIRQLEQHPARTAKRAAAVLTTWQRGRCARLSRPKIYHPSYAPPRTMLDLKPPRIVVRAPQPIVDREPPATIVRIPPPRGYVKYVDVSKVKRIKPYAPAKAKTKVTSIERISPHAKAKAKAKARAKAKMKEKREKRIKRRAYAKAKARIKVTREKRIAPRGQAKARIKVTRSKRIVRRSHTPAVSRFRNKPSSVRVAVLLNR